MASSQDATATGSKQLKVDNWGTFFLHRLQMLYEKNENCDLKLEFHDGGEINVHKLVLMTCTDYFKNLTMTPDNRLVLPPLLKYSCVLPIVNFMYTGKLDFKYENHTSLLITAKLLNMTILVKLLNAQIKPQDEKPSSSCSSSPVTKYPSKKVMVSPSTPTGPPTNTLPGKKLPFWKKRTIPGHLPDEFYQSEAMQTNRQIKIEPAKPTRFEWPEESDHVKPSPVTMYSPSFDNISYDSEVLVKPLKRPLSLSSEDQEPLQGQEECSEGSPLESTVSFAEKIKRFKSNSMEQNCFGLESDDDDDDNDSQFQSVHNNDVDDNDNDDHGGGEEGVIVYEDNDVRIESVNSNESSVVEHQKNISVSKAKVPPQNLDNAKNSVISISPAVSTPKPILKPLTSDLTPSSNQSKKVRFSLASEEKENSNKKAEKQILVQNNVSSPGNVPAKVTDPAISSNKSNTNNTSNHAKIIAEVLKKYPDLVKNNKNIRLKIMTPNNKTGVPTTLPSTQSASKTTPAKSKVSYVVMKSELNNQSTQQEENVIVNSPLTGAENTTGPWFCHTCGTNNEPLNFETYYSYRRHLQDVHMERIDARICEHCGCKSSKRNLHLYHLYTKHNILPPRNINFPKCDQCDYIALSDSLLIKHRNSHIGVSKDYTCKVCKSTFKSHGALQGHMQTSLHNDSSNKEYQCDYCDKTFNRNINLKAHIRTAHKDESRKLYDEEDPTAQQNLLQVIQVPVIDSLQSNLKGQQTLLLPAGMTILAESPAVPLLPSSESEALNNMASSIATSLNLNESNIISDQTVIFLDSNSELLFDQSGNPIVMSESTVVSGGGAGEYIIPEMIANGNSISQVFTTQAQTVMSEASQVIPVSVAVSVRNQQQQEPCSDIADDTPEVRSNDHTYAEESVQQIEDIDAKSLQASSKIESNEINITETTHHDNLNNQEIQNRNDDATEELDTKTCITGDTDQLISRTVETIQFAAGSTSNDLTKDSNNQPMEVCERDSIIIEPSSVIQHPSIGVSPQRNCLQEAQNTPQTEDSSESDDIQCINSGSVIVTSNAPTLIVNSKALPKDELVRDWDDFGEDDDDDDVNASCSLEEIEDSEQTDDVRPSRPTIELEETILPDM